MRRISRVIGLISRFVNNLKVFCVIINLGQIDWHCLDDKDMVAYPDLMQVDIIFISFINDFIIMLSIL